MEVIFYQTPDGSEPAKEFLLAINTKIRAKVARTITLLETNGTALREPYSKHLGEGIFELRTQFANDAARILFFFWVGDMAVLTNGFLKKTQKTPAEEIERAKSYRRNFLERNTKL